MAGSLNHIVAADGTFTMDLIENMRDAHGALEECHQIIAVLLTQVPASGALGPRQALNNVLDNLGFPRVKATPVIEPELHGGSSAWKG